MMLRSHARNQRTLGVFGLVWAFFIGQLFVGGCTSRSTANPPNVVIILTDDLGYGDVSCYDSDAVNTPAIDHLAENGVKFTDFYVPTPYCAPSRATLITGRFPLRHQLIVNPTPDAGIDDVGLADRELTLGEIFQDAGYKTKLIGKWHLGHKPEYYPVRHGFDEYLGILYSNDMRPVQLIANDGDTVQYPVDQRQLTKTYTSNAREFITENKDQPFFLLLSHAMPHKPLAASDRFYTPDTPGDLYADVIRELDWSVGQVTEHLKELNLLDNTLVIFMSDNGPWYGGSTGGFKGMKATTWEGGIRVPFIAYYPKKFSSAVIKTPAWSPDILPTVLSITGVEAELPNPIDGIDLIPIMLGKSVEHPPVFSMHGDHMTSVRQGKYKLFVAKPRSHLLPEDWVDPRGPDGTTIVAQMEQARPSDYPGLIPTTPEKEIQLFNLEEDPSEANDLADTNPDKVAELMVSYKNYLKAIE